MGTNILLPLVCLVTTEHAIYYVYLLCDVSKRILTTLVYSTGIYVLLCVLIAIVSFVTLLPSFLDTDPNIRGILFIKYTSVCADLLFQHTY